MVWPVVGLVVLAPMALPGVAFAHAILEDSTPPPAAPSLLGRWICAFATTAGSTAPGPA